MAILISLLLVAARPLSYPVIDSTFQAADATPTVEEVLSNISMNEGLYENIEVQWTEDYRVDESGFTSSKESAFRDALMSYHVVYQNNMIVSLRKTTGYVYGTGAHYDFEYAYSDGTKGINIYRDRVSITHGDPQYCRLFGPHRNPLSNHPACIPLSLFLRGGDALRTHSRVDQFEKSSNVFRKLSVSSGSVAGRDVVICELYHGLSPRAADRYLYYLDPDRNYMPLRAEQYSFQFPAMLATESTVEEWKELTPGVWFPMKWIRTTYDGPSAHNGVHQVSNRLVGTVTQVALSPDKPIAFFRDVKIPRPTTVYEFEDGKVVKRYELGEFDTIPGFTDSSASRNWWLVVAGVIVISGVLLFVIYRILRSRAVRAA